MRFATTSCFAKTLSEALILPINPASEPSQRWTDGTVGFSSAVLDRMESAVAKVRNGLKQILDTPDA
jgi:hypothetical protein